MKTKDYVKKYNLEKGTKFNHQDFVSDLSFDLLTLLEVGKGRENVKGFDNAVNAIKMKFDAINNKTVGDISKIWGYFFATVVVKLKAELFPDFVKMKQEERDKRKREWEERKRWEESAFGFDDWFNSILSSLVRQQIPTSSFQVLGLETTASLEDVKNAYRKLSIQHHPDKGGNSDKFIEITEAKNKLIAYLS